MRTLLLAVLLLPLAACAEEPENIQAKAENLSRQLERRADEISAEAENQVASQAVPLEAEAETLLNQMNAANAAAAEGAAANAH